MVACAPPWRQFAMMSALSNNSVCDTRRRSTRAIPPLHRSRAPAHHLQRPRPMRKLILRNFQSPGDIVMLTAAVRDLHRSYPGEFLTDVRTPCPELWAHNPHLTPLAEDDPGVETIDCHYPLIHRGEHDAVSLPSRFPGVSQRAPRPADPRHRLQGRHPHLRRGESLVRSGREDRAGRRSVTGCSCRAESSTSRSSGGITSAISRSSITSPAASSSCRSAKRRIITRRCAASIDLRGQTSLRQLVRLMYHAQGAVSPVSLLMHLAAAVPTPPGAPRNRPVRRGRGRPRAAALHRVSAPPVHSHRRRAAMLRQRRLLEVANRAARRRRREGPPGGALRRRRRTRCRAAWT